MIVNPNNILIGIYEIRNLNTNKVYIGSSKNLLFRYKTHFRNLKNNKHINLKLQSSFNKHGESAFVFTVLERVDNVDQLVLIEQIWIDWMNCVSNGYNISPKAGGNKGYKQTEAQRKKNSEIQKARGWKPSKEQLLLAEAGRKAVGYKPPSQETKDKISKSLTGRKLKPFTDEHKKNISEGLKGKSSWALGKPKSEDTKAKLSAALKGKPHSEERKLAIRLGMEKKKLERELLKLLEEQEELNENYTTTPNN